MKNQLVVNWHILEECNFGCRYCFAHWPQADSREIWKNPKLWKKLLVELLQLPNIVPGTWDSIRLNIAGGEPMLLWNKDVLKNIFSHACDLDFRLSIISNGYLMDNNFIREWSPKLQIIGISMDSFDMDTNQKIGRCGKSNKKQISPQRIEEIFQLARQYNPSIECKLNTVVNAENWQENMSSTIFKINPDRWKIFKMLPIADTPEIRDKQSPLKVNEQQFKEFLTQHEKLRSIMAPEGNDEMTESYIMVNPSGHIYQNKPNNSAYIISDPIHKVGVEKAFKQIRFKSEKFSRRYIPVIPN